MKRPTLVYDGDCGICTKAARLIGDTATSERRRLQVPADADLVAFQHADLAALGTTAERAEYELLWIQDGRVYGGAQAVARLLIDAGGFWRPLGLLTRVPPFRWIAHGLYRLIADNRHRLPGGTPACALPAAERPGAR
ncbi:MAG: thiol-disulfide oxidoreductase DCC family protein [Actinoallomurus sp.]